MTNAGRYISHLSKIVDAPGEALPDAEIICRFAQKMGFHGFDFKNTSEIYDEHAALTKGTTIDISDLNYEILKKKRSVQWPYMTGPGMNCHGLQPMEYRGTPRLFEDKKFYTSSQKAQIHSFDDSNQSEPVNEVHPLILTTGRIRDQWHTMSKTGKVNKLKQHISESFLEIHPDDAEERNINEGELVDVFNERGKVRVKAKLSTDIKKEFVFCPCTGVKY
jgi:ferredoxin-nitrate reductase